MTRAVGRLVVIVVAVSLCSGIARAVSITNLTKGKTLFSHDFESQLFPPSIGAFAVYGSGPTIESAPPGAAQGTYYLSLFRDSDPTTGRYDPLIAEPIEAGDVVQLDLMVYLPSESDVNARAQICFCNGFFDSARAWVRPNGAGQVAVVSSDGSGGFVVTDTAIPYATDQWQHWSLTYTIGGSTFDASVDGVQDLGLPSYSSGLITGAVLFNGASDPPGSFFVDAVPIPEPASSTMVALGIAVVGFGRRRRLA